MLCGPLCRTALVLMAPGWTLTALDGPAAPFSIEAAVSGPGGAGGSLVKGRGPTFCPAGLQEEFRGHDLNAPPTFPPQNPSPY